MISGSALSGTRRHCALSSASNCALSSASKRQVSPPADISSNLAALQPPLRRRERCDRRDRISA
jgi:hypothetical protein